MKVSEIDEKIKNLSKENLDQGNLLYLMILIEKKLNQIFEPVDLLPFSSLIRKLNLPEEQEKLIINYRNKLAHNIISEQELAKIKQELKLEFIPFILSISSDRTHMKPYEFEDIIFNKLKYFGNELGYRVIRNQSISIDKAKKTRLEIDAIVESDSESIIFEIKASSEKKIISVGINQLKTRLNIFGSRFGVLVLRDLFYEEIHEENYEILIIGELVMHRLPDWINKIKTSQKN